MLKRKGEPTGDLSGFLDQGTEIKGEVSFKDTLRIDGKFEGAIRSGRHLMIGESADVTAEVEVSSVYVSGRLQGRVQASERVELQPSARVYADISTPVLVIEEGAVFEGRSAMQSSRPREASPRPVESSHMKKVISSI